MKTNLKSVQLILIGAMSLTVMLAHVRAQERIIITSHDLPFYARFEAELIHTDGQWAAIPFYRPPDCVRPDFNLLQLFDVPAAFGCSAPEPYLIGFGIWLDVPDGVDPVKSGLPPILGKLELVPDQTMPVWFVDLAELEAAMTDGVVTILELAALPSLKVGAATFYTEMIHPLEGAEQTMISVVAKGLIADGRAFHYTATETLGVLREVTIEFKEAR